MQNSNMINTVQCIGVAELISKILEKERYNNNHPNNSIFITIRLNDSYTLSISVPPSISYNEEEPNIPYIVETALYYKDQYFTSEEWGYESVKYIYENKNTIASDKIVIDKLCKEIKRLQRFIRWKFCDKDKEKKKQAQDFCNKRREIRRELNADKRQRRLERKQRKEKRNKQYGNKRSHAPKMTHKYK